MSNLHPESPSNFWLTPELNRWQTNLTTLPRAEAITTSWNQTKEMLSSFWMEYLAQLPVLPIPVELRPSTDGAPRLFASKYKDWLTNTILPEERSGAVLEAITKIESFLATAPDGSLGVFTSPPGPSGLVDTKGKPISYFDTQTYIFHKVSANHISAHTIVTSMDLKQNEGLFAHLNGHPSLPAATPVELRLEALVSNPALIDASKPGPKTPHDIVNLIEIYGKQKLPKVHDYLDSPDQLDQAWHDLTQAQQALKNFEVELYQLPDDISLILNTLAQRLPYLLAEISAASRHIPPTTIDYAAEISYLDSLSGCSGGGFYTVMDSALGPRLISKFVLRCGHCQTWIGDYISRGYVCQNFSCRKVYLAVC